jgi:hypothetical protein
MPGTVKIITGPSDPTNIDQKIAGFSMDAHRRYRKGCEKNRGAADIVSRFISIVGRSRDLRTYSIDHLRLLIGRIMLAVSSL